MNNKEFAKFLGITEPTIYNWRKEKPNLFKIVMDWKNSTKEVLLDRETKELMQAFKKLTDDERRMYLAEIKLRAMEKDYPNKNNNS